MTTIKATSIFEKTWNAINARNPDGTRKYRYIIHEGSSRSSKTFSLIQAYYLYASGHNEKRLSVWRDTKKDCKDTVLKDMRGIYPKMPNYHSIVTFNKTESIFQFRNESTIEIAGTDDEEKIHGFQGDAIWINEPYKVPKETFDQLDMRTSDFVFIDWNPKKVHWIDDLKKNKRTLVIHSTFRDNPFCPPEQKSKILGYQPVKLCDAVTSGLLTESIAKKYDIIVNPVDLTPKQIKELSRCINNEDSNSANEFNWMVYGLGLKAEKPNRIFFWDRISYQEWLQIDVPIYYGVDWGAVDPMGILAAKYYDGGLYLHELNYASENEIREKLGPTELHQILGNEEGLITWLFNKLEIPYDATIVCDNNRRTKIIALRDGGWEYAIAAVKPPGSIMDGVDSLNSLKVYYTSESKNLEYEQENYERKVDRYGIVLEEPKDENNHLMDPTRYVLQFLQSQKIVNII